MILGIDGGLEGGFALVDSESVIVEVMPTKDGKLDLPGIMHLLLGHTDIIQKAYLEMAGMRRMQSTQSAFGSGRNFGSVEGILASLHIPYVIVQPNVWSANYDHGIRERDPVKRYRMIKEARRGIATRLYPGIDLRKNDRCKFPHEGVVDALLVADYGYRLTKGKNPI